MRYVRKTDRLVHSFAQRVRALFLSIHRDERGQAMTEYTVLLCAVSLVSAVTVVSIGGLLLDKFTASDRVLNDFITAVTANL